MGRERGGGRERGRGGERGRGEGGGRERGREGGEREREGGEREREGRDNSVYTESYQYTLPSVCSHIIATTVYYEGNCTLSVLCTMLLATTAPTQYPHVIVACSQLTETEHVLPNLIEVIGLSLLWGMQNDDSGAQDGEQAAHLPVQVQPLLEQVGGEHSTAHVHVYICMYVEGDKREREVHE